MLKRIISGTTLAVLVLGTLIFTFNIQQAEALGIVGDVNGDGKVDLEDLAQAVLAFGSYPNHPRWNPEADINGDNVIDMIDLHIIAENFGEKDTTVITATVDICPKTLNLKSRGRWITAYIELPEGYDVSDINASSILLNGTIPAKSRPIAIGDHDDDGIPDLMVKFKRREVISLILRNCQFRDKRGTSTLTITGKLKDGTSFKGSDTIKIARARCHIRCFWLRCFQRWRCLKKFRP